MSAPVFSAADFLEAVLPVRQPRVASRDEGPPKVPGFARLRTGGFKLGEHSQTTHLVRWVERAHGVWGTPGPTLCGLSRFDERDPVTYALLRTADIPGWSVEGGLFGGDIVQVRCDECYRLATDEAKS